MLLEQEEIQATGRLHIRRAEVADLPRIYGCAMEFYGASKILGRLPFRLERFVELWTQLIENGSGVVFIAEQNYDVAGSIAGVVTPDLYSGLPVAAEFFWIVRKEKRGPGIRLYQAFESWAREQQCVEIRMVHLADSMPERLAKFYTRLGYREAETLFVKRLVQS